MRGFDAIYEVVKLIPYGRVSTYGAIAKYLGTGARMVGWAMNAAHTLHEVPAHRVVNRIGLLTGKMHFETPSAMQEALEKEGIRVEKDIVIDFRNINWIPSDELL
jgi:methylated-DNA-protein-cysteine methyltransferase related protein